MRARGENGVTLIEVMLAMVVSMAIVVPLTAWIVMGFRQQHDLQVTSRDGNTVNFVSAYLPRDVASATTVQLGGSDCSGPVLAPTTTLALPASMGATTSTSTALPAFPRTVLLTLDYSGDDNIGSRTLYVVDDEPEGGALRRLTCDVSGTLSSDTRLAWELVTPAGGWGGLATCEPFPVPGDECRRVTMTMTGTSGRRTSISAVRRTTNALPAEPAS